ncbi:unnamed protein product [Lymnaea stagnalis]|uniref:Peptidase M12B domain-containing protein n=1 Tax=Lymnaea stagnalis TaxID=6523 RepID=A0AAV2IET7_LYMST
MTRRTSSTSCVLNLVTCLALHLLWLVAVSSIEVKVDYTSNDQQGNAMPDDINVTVSTGTNTTAILRLSRVPHINLDFPLYTLNHDGTGTIVKQREKRATKKMTAFYQEKATGAVFQITRKENRRNKTDLFKLKGAFKISGKSFFLKSEKRRKRNFQTTASSTTSRSTSKASSPSMSDTEDEIYSLEVQRVQRPTIHDFMEAPPEVIVSRKTLTMSNALNVSDLDSQDQDTKNDTTSSTAKPEADQIIALSSEQSPIQLVSDGSSAKPDLFAKLIRRRRAITPIAVDVAAVVDYSVYLKFLTEAGNDRTAALQNIREYFAFIFNGVDQRYQSININTGFHVYLSQVFVAETGSTSPLADTSHPNNFIDANEALEAFENFVAQRAKDVVTSYDHAMLFTAYNLTDGTNTNIAGFAYVSTLCRTDGSSVSVIEEMNDYESIIIAAHELGHSLSAQHDGDDNYCSSSDRYIMAAVTGTAETASTVYHPWQFSTCSVESFKSYLNQQLLTSRGVICLDGHPPMDNTIPDVSGRLLGQEIPPDQQCQATHGPDSRVCRGVQKIGSDVCHALYCLDTGDYLCYPKAALDGTTCGNLKICRSGQCVSDPQAPTADESCVFGDQPGIVWQGMTCPQFVNYFKGVCYNAQNQKICCKSCRDAYSTLRGCEYGDRFTNCTTQFCSQLPVDCCGTCNNGVPFTTKPTTAVTVTYAPRLPTQNPDPGDDVCRNRELSCYFLKDDAVTQCYDSVFNRKCCQFCQQHLTKIPGCEYGDRSPQLCRDRSVCSWNAYLCCQFCIPPSTTGYPSIVTTDESGESGAASGCSFGPHTISLILLVVCSMCLAY